MAHKGGGGENGVAFSTTRTVATVATNRRMDVACKRTGERGASLRNTEKLSTEEMWGAERERGAWLPPSRRSSIDRVTTLPCDQAMSHERSCSLTNELNWSLLSRGGRRDGAAHGDPRQPARRARAHHPRRAAPQPPHGLRGRRGRVSESPTEVPARLATRRRRRRARGRSATAARTSRS